MKLGTGVIGGRLPVVMMTATRTDGNNRNVFTYSDVPIGDPSPERLIVFAYEAVGFTSTFDQNLFLTVNGATPDYVSGTVAGAYGVHQIAVPTGTTATFVVDRTTGGMIAGALIVWAIYGLRSHVPVDAQLSFGAGASKSVNLTARANGAAIGYGRDTAGSGSASFAWSGLNETADFAIGGSVGAAEYQTAALGNRMSAGVHTVGLSVTRSGSPSTVLIAASWR